MPMNYPPAGNNTSIAYRDIEEEIESAVCRRETSLLFVLLMLGTREYHKNMSLISDLLHIFVTTY